MKFNVKTNDFQKAIASVEGVISVREIKSILSNLKIEAKDDNVSISATDLEISIKTSIPATVHSEGVGLIPAKQISTILKAINFSETSVDLSENESEGNAKTTIRDADGKVDFKMVINGISSEDVKSLTKIKDIETVDFTCHTLGNMIKKTYHSVAVDDTRFVFNGLFLKSINNKLVIAGTDGRRLSKVEREFETTLSFDNGVIIPHKAIKEMLKIIEHNETAAIGLIDNQIYLKTKDMELLCKLIDGNYPDYEAVIPKENRYKIIILKDNFFVSLKQALIAAEEPSRQVKLKFFNNNLNIHSSTPGTTEADINIPIAFDGEETTIAFKGDYLIDLVKTIEGSEIIIEFNNANAPVIFRDPEDFQYVAVVMPMKL
jgi:DNA polymerase III subunit beta